MLPRFTFLALVAASLLLAPVTASAQAPEPQSAKPLRAEIAALVAQARHSGLRASPLYEERDWLEKFYGAHDYAPVWSANSSAQTSAAQALAQLQQAHKRGLPPSDYQVDWLSDQAREIGAGVARTDRVARFDVALTLAMLRYLADLHAGRVRSTFVPAAADSRIHAFDPVAVLRQALVENRLASAIDAAEPVFPIYRRLKTMLELYRQLALRPHPPLTRPPRNKKIEPGIAYRDSAALQERLAMLGDLPGDAPVEQDGRYGPTLSEALKRFQDRHGIDPDGVLGAQTLAALNVPLDQRVRQIELALERLRWLPDLPDGALIAINIPSYQLWAFDAGPRSLAPALEMRVIVGKAMRTQTPAFIGDMRYIEFNPYWNVPGSIARGEILPKLARDAMYLKNSGMELVPVTGAANPIGSVDAAALSALRAGKLRVRQRPGTNNALGAVKFVLPNDMNIYLHSTPARELFKRSRRDFSHGCIRVEDPLALAQFVLRGQPEWTPEKIESALAPGKTRTVKLAASIPVVIFYTTAITDQDGKARFLDDVYRLDQPLERALRERSNAILRSHAAYHEERLVQSHTK